VKLVVDTNIVISTMITNRGVVGEVFLRTLPPLELYAPELLRSEVSLYRIKIAKAAKLTEEEIAELESRVLHQVREVPHEAISSEHWERAFDLVKGIDEKDDQFVALALHLGVPLWSGDKKLVAGLRKKGFKLVVTTEELRKRLA
jgi:predicted nucleic acid-binding protein